MPTRLEGLQPPDRSILSREKRKPLFELELSLITPMFGGGFSPREIDPERPVNAKEVRGHLRFWWRACHAHRYPDTEAMFRDEALLFGQASGDKTGLGPGVVDVLAASSGLQTMRTNELRDSGGLFGAWSRRHEEYNWRPHPSYALFPFIEGSPNPEFAKTLAITLEIHGSATPTQGADLKRALSAWVLLGGIGSRTRRGCGSLFLKASNPQLLTCDQLMAAVKSVEGNHRPWGIPRLKDAAALRPMLANPMPHWQCWLGAVSYLYSFRQIGRGRISMGSMSNWPETDAIRRQAGGRYRNGPRSAASYPDYYPRADLGLPIGFEFKDMPAPPKHTLAAAGREMTRMGSPIITKALPLDENQSDALILVLDAPHVWDRNAPEVKLEPGGVTVSKVSGQRDAGGNPLPDLTTASFAGPLRVGATTYATAREAFVAYVKTQRFTEVII